MCETLPPEANIFIIHRRNSPHLEKNTHRKTTTVTLTKKTLHRTSWLWTCTSVNEISHRRNFITWQKNLLVDVRMVVSVGCEGYVARGGGQHPRTFILSRNVRWDGDESRHASCNVVYGVTNTGRHVLHHVTHACKGRHKFSHNPLHCSNAFSCPEKNITLSYLELCKLLRLWKLYTYNFSILHHYVSATQVFRRLYIKWGSTLYRINTKKLQYFSRPVVTLLTTSPTPWETLDATSDTPDTTLEK